MTTIGCRVLKFTIMNSWYQILWLVHMMRRSLWSRALWISPLTAQFFRAISERLPLVRILIFSFTMFIAVFIVSLHLTLWASRIALNRWTDCFYFHVFKSFLAWDQFYKFIISDCNLNISYWIIIFLSKIKKLRFFMLTLCDIYSKLDEENKFDDMYTFPFSINPILFTSYLNNFLGWVSSSTSLCTKFTTNGCKA